MRINVKRTFRYQVDAQTVKELLPGIHDLPTELAVKVLKFGKAEKVQEFRKVAPENKVAEAAETKSDMEGAAVRRSRSRTKPD